MSATDIEPGDALTLADRLSLKAAGPGRWRSLHGDANQNGRSYGGQLLGQALRAALMEAPEGRPPTMMQFLFLQGAMPDQPIVFDVKRLQDGATARPHFRYWMKVPQALPDDPRLHAAAFAYLSD